MPKRTKNELLQELERLQSMLDAQEVASEKEAKKAKARHRRLSLLEATMETVPVGVVIADETGRILYGNSQVERMVRHPVLHSDNVDAYGEWISYHPDGRRVESHEYPLSRVIRDGDSRAEIDVHYQRGDGSRFWMRIIGEPVFDDQGTLIGATVALIDIDREEELRRDKDLLIAELNHRVKNAFAVVKSIVAQSMRGADLPFDLRARLDARLDAYAKAHAALVGTTWDKASLQDVAKEVLEQVAGSRAKITGPAVGLPAKQALAFSMAFFELATNAFKYGALSGEDGEVMLSWSRETRAGISSLVVRWQEGGGPIVTEPNSTGFGSLIAGRVISLETEGTVEREFRPNGLFWKLTMPWPQEEAESR